ncbi:MAG: metallophosphoesterase [Magnetospirillum sp.]|nr:metallophosphoesterase [Magnetospirillum sp.]
MAFRWLHLSDIHEKSSHGSDIVYAAILKHVQEQMDNGHGPDAVFMTGDFVWSGQASQFALLESRFLGPLKSILGEARPFFMVPGNHDLDRDLGSSIPEDEQDTFFQADDAGQRKRRCTAQVRFGAYATFAKKWGAGAWADNWLDSKLGGVHSLIQKEGKKIAVIGFNTAWLCVGKKSPPNQDDYGTTSPGVDLVRHTLIEVAKENPDLIIALGHHPLETLIQKDVEDMRRLLRKQQVLYLHGHLHQSTIGQPRGEALLSYSVQATAAFQAHATPDKPNGLMWAEADLFSGKLFLEPLKHQTDGGWYFDTALFDPKAQVHGKNRFWAWLPGRSPTTPATTETHHWRLLNDFSTNPASPQSLATFFAGGLSSPAIALAPDIARLAAADRIFDQIQSIDEYAQTSTVIWVYGPCGEGKTTAALQAAKMAADSGWRVWFQPRATTAQFVELAALISTERSLVLIDLPTITPEELIAFLSSNASPVTVLLVTHQLQWHKSRKKIGTFADMKDVPITGLHDEADALKICVASGKTDDGNVSALIAATNKSDTFAGSLLGAALQNADGGEGDPRLSIFLKGMKNSDPKLFDAYAMVAAMQAVTSDGVAETVLASALGLQAHVFHQDLWPALSSETLWRDNEYILTRHPSIARRVLDIGTVWDENSVGDYFRRLARSTLQCRDWNHPDSQKWRQIVEHFLQHHRNWALPITQSLLEVKPAQSEVCALHARALRLAKSPDESLAFCHRNAVIMAQSREGLLEWHMAQEGLADHLTFGTLLCLRGMSDGPTGHIHSDLLKLAANTLQQLEPKICKYASDSCRWLLWRMGLAKDDLVPNVPKNFGAINAIKGIRSAAEAIYDLPSLQSTKDILLPLGRPQTYAFDDLLNLLPEKDRRPYQSTPYR